jgi:hypothetical protein
MDVSEGRRQKVARSFDPIEPPGNLEHVLGRGVELISSASPDPILHPSNNPGLHLKDKFIFMTAFEQFDRDAEVLLEGEIAPVEHVAVEEVRFTRGAASLRLFDKRDHILI